MEDKLTIAIYDATEPLAMALAKTLSKGPYRLLLISENTSMLQGLQSEIINYSWETDAEAIKSLTDTQSKADVFIPAGPYSKETDIVRVIKKPAKGKIVISMSNPGKKDSGRGSDVHKISAAEELQKLLPDSKVVKAFSTISLANFKQPAFNGQQIDSFIAGDDDTAVEIVDQLVRTAGFNPVILDGLSASRKLEEI
jgi:predicted dinucleotide-binding enzyme